MKAKLQSNIELYSLGHFYHLNEIKINFLKGQKYFIAYLLTKVQMLPLKLKKKKRESVHTKNYAKYEHIFIRF